jgi:hypothetical protein
MIASYDGYVIRFGVIGIIKLGSDLPAIGKTLVVDGSSQTVQINGAGDYRIFKITTPGNLTLKNLILQNGHSKIPCMQDIVSTCGGAIYDDGILSATGITFLGKLGRHGRGHLHRGRNVEHRE